MSERILKLNDSFDRSSRILIIKCDEELDSIIDKISHEYSHVDISIEKKENALYEVRLLSPSYDNLNNAEAMFRSLLPINGQIHGLDPNSKRSIDMVYDYAKDNLFVHESIEIIEKCLNEYKNENICISFNGGKDCTALLRLVHAVFAKRSLYSIDNPMKLNALYIKMPVSFPSLDTFVHETVNRYTLELLTYLGPDFKVALQGLKNNTTIEAIFMGTRASDLPNTSALSPFQQTDNGWPKFLRVNPLLNWTYNQVWSFLRDLNVPYCSLYDHGYTSLGSPNNTRQNPLLEFTTKNGEVCYLPAYMLQDPDKERTSRTQ